MTRHTLAGGSPAPTVAAPRPGVPAPARPRRGEAAIALLAALALYAAGAAFMASGDPHGAWATLSDLATLLFALAMLPVVLAVRSARFLGLAGLAAVGVGAVGLLADDSGLVDLPGGGGLLLQLAGFAVLGAWLLVVGVRTLRRNGDRALGVLATTGGGGYLLGTLGSVPGAFGHPAFLAAFAAAVVGLVGYLGRLTAIGSDRVETHEEEPVTALNPHTVMNTVIHDGLRRDLERMRQVLSGPVPDDQRVALCRFTPWLLAELHHHHIGEDEGIWPRVLAKAPDLQVLADQMESEHEVLAAAADRLRAAAAAYGEDGSDEKRAAMLAAVVAMQEATLPHLEHEETAAMPVVVEVLDDDDWAWLDKNYFRKGRSLADLGQVGTWFLDDLDPERAALVRTQIPAPLLWVLSLRYGSAYDRAAQRRWGTLAGTRS
ncbi:MAG: hemerythrin domain-containing protein [Candidatus Nanopelagicales bacterium]